LLHIGQLGPDKRLDGEGKPEKGISDEIFYKLYMIFILWSGQKVNWFGLDLLSY
jgi:hypothetical protein